MNTSFAARFLHLLALDTGFVVECDKPDQAERPGGSNWLAYSVADGACIWDALTWESIVDAINYIANSSCYSELTELSLPEVEERIADVVAGEEWGFGLGGYYPHGRY